MAFTQDYQKIMKLDHQRSWKMFHLTWFLVINHDQSWFPNSTWERQYVERCRKGVNVPLKVLYASLNLDFFSHVFPQSWRFWYTTAQENCWSTTQKERVFKSVNWYSIAWVFKEFSKLFRVVYHSTRGTIWGGTPTILACYGMPKNPRLFLLNQDFFFGISTDDASARVLNRCIEVRYIVHF